MGRPSGRFGRVTFFPCKDAAVPRLVLRLLWGAALAALGCRPAAENPPATSSAAPSPDRALEKPAPQGAAKPASSAAASAQAHSPPLAPAPSSAAVPAAGQPALPPAAAPAGAARDLAARLLTSDGQSGWRIDEQAATELEKRTAAELLPLLDDAAVDVRRGAGHQLLARFNPADEAQVAAINNLLADSDPTIRGFALAAVRQMRPADQAAAAAAVAELLAAEREARADNRAAAARFLASLRADAATLLPQLAAAATTDPDAIVRAAALAAVAQVAPTDRKLPVLLKGLADAEGSVRLVAAARLRALGAEAKSAAGPLAEALGDSDARVRDAAAAALLQLGDEAVPVLGEQLASPRLEACKYALACLAKLGPAARPARAAVEKCRQDADAEVRKLAELALAAMGGP